MFYRMCDYMSDKISLFFLLIFCTIECVIAYEFERYSECRMDNWIWEWGNQSFEIVSLIFLSAYFIIYWDPTCSFKIYLLLLNWSSDPAKKFSEKLDVNCYRNV